MQRSISLFAVALTATLCACSKDAPKQDSTAIAPPGGAGGATGTKSAASFDPATHTVVLHAKDYSFDAPEAITGGWTTFHLVNDGPNIHHAQLVRLDSGKTVSDLETAFKNPGPPPRWAVFAGGANAPDPGGGQSDAIVNLEPGNYAIICVVDLPDHVPHINKGMIRPLTVGAVSATPAAEPTSDVSVILSDYSFAVSGPMTAGKHTVKVTNKGPQPHELELIKIEPGKTVKDVAAFIDKPTNGPPPLSALGGVAVVMKGSTSYATFDLTAGHYAFFCFVPDMKDGKMHVEHGMVKEFTIQ